jgi:hypothetical protein
MQHHDSTTSVFSKQQLQRRLSSETCQCAIVMYSFKYKCHKFAHTQWHDTFIFYFKQLQFILLPFKWIVFFFNLYNKMLHLLFIDCVQHYLRIIIFGFIYFAIIFIQVILKFIVCRVIMGKIMNNAGRDFSMNLWYFWSLKTSLMWPSS